MNNNTNNENQKRKEAIENYTFYINQLSGDALENEYQEALEKAKTTNALLNEPDVDDDSDGDIVIR